MLEVIASTGTIVNPQITTAVNNMFALAFQTGLLALVGGLTWAVTLGLSSIKNSIVRAFAQRAVAYAAQRLSSVSDEEKRKVVAEKIHKKFPRLPSEEVEHFLEEAYTNLQAGLKSAST